MGQRDELRRQLMQAVTLDHVTVDIVGAVRERGIDCLVLKGPAIAEMLYPAAVRPAADCDLLVPADREREVMEILRSQGYQGADREAYKHRSSPHAIVFKRPDGATVDLHVTIPGVACSSDRVWDVLWGDHRFIKLGSHDIPVPARPAVLCHIALHAIHHGKLMGKPLEDLNRAIDTAGADDWSQAADVARRLEVTDRFFSGLRMTQGGQALADRLTATHRTTVEAELHAQTPPVTARGWHRLLATPGLLPKLRTLRHAVFPPREYMSVWWAYKPRPPRPLMVMYVYRVVHLLRDAPRSVFANVRARRRASSRP